ncbi:MAG: sulfatase [Saprospiraceae bacterium]|nr:sulfatase [Saprospiraceae bacterium]
MKNLNLKSFLLFLIIGIVSCDTKKEVTISTSPNVLVIMVDDLNDNIGALKGHPQALTPNMDKLAHSATLFLHAYSNAPMCGPSRASMFTGIYPHHSNNYFQEPWFQFETLTNSRTIMEQFKKEGYNVIGTGKIMHHNRKEMWTHFENDADYSPTPFDGVKQVPHPDVPAAFAEIGWVDGSLGPFLNLESRTNSQGKPLQWITGNERTGFNPMRYINDDDRDPTPDERNATWVANKLKELAVDTSGIPFFLSVGFLRPHTPLVAPQKYFKQFPLENIQLVAIESEDEEDTHLTAAYQGDLFTLSMGKRMFNAISKAYGNSTLGLKKWTQAYLACVAAVDENIGEVLDALSSSGLDKNTIVVLASDHGFHMGEKNYLYKNSLWEESTRVPLIFRAPGITNPSSVVSQAVSLIDVYPTLLDLCGLSTNTTKNEKGHPLDGKSLLPFLNNPYTDTWTGAPAALSVVFAGNKHKREPSMQHYSIRTQQYRYILYNNGMEELYDHYVDPNEWNNIGSTQTAVLRKMRQQLQEIVAPVKLAGFKNMTK